MKKTLVFLLLCASFACGGQPYLVRGLSVPTNRTSLRSIDLVSANRYIVAGSYMSATNSTERAIISLIDVGGLLPAPPVWTRVFDISDGYSFFHIVKRTTDGGFIAAGQSGVQFGFIAKFDALGNFLWRTDLSENHVSYFYDIIEVSNGDIWACGHDGTTALLARFTSAGVLIVVTQPSNTEQSILLELFNDGATVVAFGKEEYPTDDPQISARRFDLLGNEISHFVFGATTISPTAFEHMSDAVPIVGGYAIVTQYLNPVTGFNDLGVLYIDNSLGVLTTSSHHGYSVAGYQLFAPRAVVDNNSLYIFPTKLGAAPGAGTMMMKISRTDGSVQATTSVARGRNFFNSIFWNGGNIVCPSSQDLVSNIVAPPETQTDLSYIDPVTLNHVGLLCDLLPLDPVVIEHPYDTTVVMVSIPPINWDVQSITGIAGPDPSLGQLIVGTCDNMPLPVELSNFEAEPEGHKVRLWWTTESERESDYFEIKRSRNGQDFEAIGIRVPAAGNSQSHRSYETYDRSPMSGTNYYRLSQIDLDGALHDYGTVAVYMIFPSDVIEAYDLSGRLVYHGIFAETPSGTYMVRLEGSEDSGKLVSILHE